ncbi:MAG TPA: hypothetical protein VJ604_09625, partial [Geomonas sp.]|nr:hypothetical protein [Geomonas sp.]
MMHLKLLIVAVCLFALATPVLAAPVPATPMVSSSDTYGYPIADSYDATIIGTPPKLMPVYPPKMRSRQLTLDVIPDRKKPPIFFYDKGLKVTFAWQKERAPLIFLIAG